MKKLSLLFTAMLYIMVSCQQTPQKKAESVINSSLKESLQDPSSYKSISFGKLDSAYSDKKDEPEAKKLQAEIEISYDQMKTCFDEMNLAKTKSVKDNARKEYEDSKLELDSLMKVLYAYNNSYEPYFNGFKIKHKYEVKDSLGIKTSDDVFYLDKELKAIVNVKSTETTSNSDSAKK